jgi:hypothetical protein
VLLAITAMLLIAGTALDAAATYFVFLPFLLPVAQAYQWDLVWLGIIDDQRRNRAVHAADRGQPDGDVPPGGHHDRIDAGLVHVARGCDDCNAARSHVRSRHRAVPAALARLSVAGIASHKAELIL